MFLKENSKKNLNIQIIKSNKKRFEKFKFKLNGIIIFLKIKKIK